MIQYRCTMFDRMQGQEDGDTGMGKTMHHRDKILQPS